MLSCCVFLASSTEKAILDYIARCPITCVFTGPRILEITVVYTFAIFVSMPATSVAVLRRAGGFIYHGKAWEDL